VLAAAALVVCLAALGPLGLAPTSLRGLADDLERQRARGQALDEKVAPIRTRLKAREEIDRGLAEGRLDLLEGGARSRDLTRASPTFSWAQFRQGDPADSDDERHCRLVLRRARIVAALERGEEEADRVEARLEEELREHKARGTLRLREPRPPEPA